MPHDVFISHCGSDNEFADAACAKMEQKGIQCWMVPRDVPHGEKEAKAIVEAIENCQIMVLIVSSAALATEEVESQIILAGDCKKVIIPVKIERADLTGGFKLLLAKIQSFDAMTEPVDKHLERLADDVSRLLVRIRSGRTDEPGSGAYEPPLETNAKPRFDTKPNFDTTAKVPRLASTAITLIAAVALLLVAAYLYRMNKAQATITLTSNSNPAVVGQSVTLTAALSGRGNTNGETVSFYSYNGARLLGTGQLSNGVASFNTLPATEFTRAGTRDLTASYRGDSTNAACTSPVYVQTLVAR